MKKKQDVPRILYEAKKKLPDAGMYNSGAIEVVEVPFNGKKVKVEFKRTEAGIFPVGWYEGKLENEQKR